MGKGLNARFSLKLIEGKEVSLTREDFFQVES